MHKGLPVLLVLLAALAVLLAGCGPAAATPTPAEGPPTQPPTPKLPEAATVAKPQPTSELIGGATVVLGATVEPTPTPRPLPTKPPTPTPAPIPTDTAAPAPTATGVAPTATVAPPTGPVEAPMVEIPAGEFLFGSDEQPEAGPPQQVNLPAFSIDVYEVTNAQFAAFVAATGYKTTAEQAGEPSWRDYFGQGEEEHPVVKVSWYDAEAYCKWAGKRLPTEQEWEKAARGTDGRRYPWGNEFDPEKVNGMEAGYRRTVAVGSLPAGASPYGVMDMAGNVAEWTADWYKAYPGSSYRDQYMGEKFRITRGGGWFSDKEQIQTFYRNSTAPEAANDDLGFRCAR